MRSATLAPSRRSLTEPDLAAGLRSGAGQHLQQLGAAGTHQPVEAEDLARVQLEGDVVEQEAAAQPRQRHVLDAQQRLAGRMLRPREQRGRRAADHLLDDPGDVDVRRPRVRHDATVAQHRDAVADPEQLLELVRDVDDRDAAGLQVADDPEQALDLGLR